MRNICNINADWLFKKPECAQEKVNLPHTWNGVDGQDGGADYFRGTCRYSKTIKKSDLPEADCYYLEIRGANSSMHLMREFILRWQTSHSTAVFTVT